MGTSRQQKLMLNISSKLQMSLENKGGPQPRSTGHTHRGLHA